MRIARLFVLALAVVMLRAPLRAQTGTLADGVDALLRRDYALAAAILKPLADTPWQPDPKAAFFMAVLYENGLGVAPDPLRACALFLRAGNERQTPLSAAAALLVPGRQRALGRDEFQTCSWRASVGFDDRFEPATLVLEHDHWLTWDIRSITITYRGVEKRFDRAFSLGPFRFVAIRHTELATGDTFSIRRHFVDSFKWVPARQPRTWVLEWGLNEVVRDDLVSVASAQLTTAVGDEPPGKDAIDLDALVRLRVTDTGDAELAVLAGDKRQTRVIPSESDRQEMKRVSDQQSRAHQPPPPDEAKRVRDARRPPSFAYAPEDADGCGNVFVYGWTRDRLEVMAVRADTQTLHVATTGTFDLAVPRAGLDVRLHVYERAMGPFCTDVAVGGIVEEEWRPTRGTVTVDVEPRRRADGYYRATITISGAEFVNSSGVRVSMPQPVTLAALVGRMFGN